VQKGYGKVSLGREDKWYKGGADGVRWECDGVQGGGKEGQKGGWDVLAYIMKRSARKL
jgi:hypothetical protein